MSKSINELLKNIRNGNDRLPVQDGQLDNPDIPTPDDSMEIRDQYYNVFKTPSAPRNGTFQLSNPRARLVNPRTEDFMIEGAIDPNNIRAKTDPDTAMPSLSSGSLFSLMPESIKEPKSSTNLIRSAINSSLNYSNRFFTPNVVRENDNNELEGAVQDSSFLTTVKKTITPARRQEFKRIFDQFLKDNYDDDVVEPPASSNRTGPGPNAGQGGVVNNPRYG